MSYALGKDVALYIHIPFCSNKCHYCAFSVVTDVDSKQDYLRALWQDVQQSLDTLHAGGRVIRTISFGGGTPSKLRIEELQEIIALIKAHPIAQSIDELSIEMNPEDVNKPYLKQLREIGVTRISCGIQTFNDEVLHAHNRVHNSDQAKEALTLLSTYVSNWSADIIIGLPHNEPEQSLIDIQCILPFNPTHISCYLYTDKVNAVAHRFTQQHSDLSKTYFSICQTLQDASYQHYEISNWCKPDHQSLHNGFYWQGLEYVGVGLSASSFYDGALFEKQQNFQLYCLSPSIQKATQVIHSTSDRLYYLLLTRTRLCEGVHLEQIEKLCSPSEYTQILSIMKTWQKQGLAYVTNSHFSLNEQGMLLQNMFLEQIQVAIKT